MLLALPVYQVWHSARYANTRERWLAKIAIFVTFLPVIAYSTLIWVALWTAALWLTWRFVN
jgi:hypothetical protein